MDNIHNINFFIHFNHLLETSRYVHNEINSLIDNKINNRPEDITENELIIINKYNKFIISQNDLFDKLLIISDDIKLYLNEICVHDWIIDYIDINPDYTKQIVYCSKCSTSN